METGQGFEDQVRMALRAEANDAPLYTEDLHQQVIERIGRLGRSAPRPTRLILTRAHVLIYVTLGIVLLIVLAVIGLRH